MELSLRIHGLKDALYVHINYNNNHNSWLTFIESILHTDSKMYFPKDFHVFVYILTAPHNVGSKMIPHWTNNDMNAYAV